MTETGIQGFLTGRTIVKVYTHRNERGEVSGLMLVLDNGKHLEIEAEAVNGIPLIRHESSVAGDRLQ